MKKIFLLLLIVLLFSSCMGEAPMYEDEVRVMEIIESSYDEYKYRVRLKSSGGWSYLYTNTYYVVGDKVKIIQNNKILTDTIK